MGTDNYTTMDEYIQLFPQEIQERMNTLRRVIREEAPEASEKISWQMPTFFYHGNLVHFAGHKNHIGFYPGPSGVELFLAELPEFKGSKGAVQLPHTKPLPLEVIRRVIRFRVEENLKDAEAKKLKKKK